MQRLWAPWRNKYIVSARKSRGCVLCRAVSGRRIPGEHLIFKSALSAVVLNIYPYNNGHLLVFPLRHVNDTARLREEEFVDLFECLNRAKGLLDKVLCPDGYNIGFNLGRVAGAGITGHLHMHIVPRWNGDVNFMPVVSDTKIVSQSLAELAKLLKDACRRHE